MALILVLVLTMSLKMVQGWDSEQLEVFDVVDEVKENFYSLMNISQVCNRR